MGAVSPMKPSRSFALCSGLLSILFAYSAVVQHNDYDWYIWLPFYSLACLVCLCHAIQFSTVSRWSAYAGFSCGAILFVKVVLEGCVRGQEFNWMELVSLDMEQRLVREKLGSLLVCVSLWLELAISGGALNETGFSQNGLHTGVFLLVSTSMSLCAAYFTGKE